MSELPELKPNQIGVSCKTWGGSGMLKMVDEMLYFTINKDSVAMELYPKKPVIIFDKDAARMILLKIAEVEKMPATDWINASDKLPETEGYYGVRFDDGSTDEKPFRIRPEKNIRGFMTEKNVTQWRELADDDKALAASRNPFDFNQESDAVTASAEPGADSNELKDLQDNDGSSCAEASADEEVKAGKAATLSYHSELSAQPDKDGIF